MAVHLERGDEVVVLEGEEEEVTEPTALQDFVDSYLVKYQTKVDVVPEALANSPVIRMRMRKVFAWTEKEYPGGATRWRFGWPHWPSPSTRVHVPVLVRVGD